MISFNSLRAIAPLCVALLLLPADGLQARTRKGDKLYKLGTEAEARKEYDKALEYFMTVQNHTDPRVSPALFYKSLTLLRRNHPGDEDAAKQQLRRIVQEKLNKQENARELLRKM